MTEIIIVGSGTGIPSLRRGSPAMVLLSNKLIILIDSGSGTLRSLLKVGISYMDFDLILYTHIHPDHVADLVAILFACKYSETPRKKDLTIIGGPGFKSYFDSLKKTYGPWIKPETYRLKIIERSSKPFTFKNISILPKPMNHMVESIGFRIETEDGKRLAISGDTDFCENILKLGRQVDLLILECSFPDDKKVKGHLTPSLAFKIAKESECKRLLLTHFYPLCDQGNILEECRSRYSGDLIIAEDFMRIKV